MSLPLGGKIQDPSAGYKNESQPLPGKAKPVGFAGQGNRIGRCAFFANDAHGAHGVRR